MRGFKRSVATLAVLLLGVGVVAAQTQPQFSGAYTLDRSQSQFPQHERRSQPDPQAQPAQPAQRPDIKLVVQQQGTTLKVTRIIAMGTRERSETNTYLADGTDQTRRGYRGETVTRAAFDGDRLVLTRTQTKKTDAGDRTMSRQSVWTLSPDGRTLTIDTTMQGSHGDRVMKTVYVRDLS
jgi:hypothetical protein